MNINRKLLCTMALASSATAGCAFAEETRPNIIIFMVDDMGWQDTSLPFWKEKTPYNMVYETPNMERLAKKGMMFTQAYASSISSPSRCSLLTGSNAARHCVTNWTLHKNTPTDGSDDLVVPPDWNVNGICQVPGIPHTYQATSFVQILKDNGYHTIHCGKAHFGAMDTPGENPHHFGFEVNIAGHAAGGPASYLGERNFGNNTDGTESSPFAIPGLKDYWGKDIFVTEALTIEAIKALDKAKNLDQPFFLYMSHYAVHVPYDKDMRFYDKYRNEKGMSENGAAYAALVEGMDKSLGDIMDWLEENALDENTVIMFMSDNGGFAIDRRFSNEELHTQNAPLSSGKGSAREGGIREPMIVSWPGRVEEGSKCDKYVIIEDFFPTVLDMAGIEDYETVQEVDGISMVPLLEGSGDTSKGRALFWNCPNIWGVEGPGIGPTCTVREGDWKLIYYYDTGKKELFNIKEDIGEKKNLADSNPDKTKQLSRKLGKYLRSTGAQRPVLKKTGEPAPWPDRI